MTRSSFVASREPREPARGLARKKCLKISFEIADVIRVPTAVEL